MEQMGAARAQCFTVGSDQATIDRLADIQETCSVDMFVHEAFSCAVCLELMVCPIKCFPCRHSFCEPCLRLITHAGDPLDILCPICRQTILCCGPNNALKHQIVRGDPILAIAYESRLDWFSRQEGFSEMRLPGIAGLGILPKLGAWLATGNFVADYLVKANFGLMTGRNSREICKDLLSKLFSFVFATTMFLLVPCLYLANVLQHPWPFSQSLNNQSSSNLIDVLLNSTGIANASGHNGSATPRPFEEFGLLSFAFPGFAIQCLLLLCACLAAVSSTAALNRFIRGPRPEPRSGAPAFRTAMWFLILSVLFADACFGVHIVVKYMLFGDMPYWKEDNSFAVLQFSVCTFACGALWIAMQIASVMGVWGDMIDCNGRIQFNERAKVFFLRFMLFYALLWLILITLDVYFKLFYNV